MNDNNEILNELFWKKKKSYAEKLKDSQAQYTPIKDTKSISSLFGKAENGKPVMVDMGAVNKRLISGLGMALGSNTVKSMANKAIKSFPIILSDDVSPETAVMIKTMMEEQYASYLDLLISNQIINISDYKQGNDIDGNIAIQALNKIDGTDFSSERIARQMKTGQLTADDLMKNVAGWQVLKTNTNEDGSVMFKSGNPITDLFLEDAMIVPSDKADELVQAIKEQSTLQEGCYYGMLAGANTEPQDDVIKLQFTTANIQDGDYYLDIGKSPAQSWIRKNGKWVKELDTKDASKIRNDYSELIKNYHYKDLTNNYIKLGKYNVDGNDRYTKLITPNSVVSDDFEENIEKNIGAMLNPSEASSAKAKEVARYLRDRFEKATYLLSTRRIAGFEYVSYLTDRLGIPVTDKVRKELLLRYKLTDVSVKGANIWNIEKQNGQDVIVLNKDQNVDALKTGISNNDKYIFSVVPEITKLKVKDVLAASSAGAAIGTGVGAGVGVALLTASAITASAIAWPALIGLGIGAAGGLIYKLFSNRKKQNYTNYTAHYKTEGWERVESLIDEMDRTRNAVLKHAEEMALSTSSDYEKVKEFRDEDKRKFIEFQNNMAKALNVSNSVNASMEYDVNIKGFVKPMNENKFYNIQLDLNALDESIENDEELYNNILSEANAKYVINTKTPGEVIVKQTKFKASDVLGTIPLYGTKDTMAYGSVEYDKRELKDRKFNEPLIMTIKFKERYSNGDYSDNELTAVIGILGVITRVPSEEMATILKTNAEGKTLSNFFKGDESNSTKDLIGNVIASFMGTKQSEKLPTSGKIWHNLEKVSQLAIANKLAGNNNGNISNAHIVFSQKEIDNVKADLGIDYLKNPKLSAQLMKHYSAFMLMVCNDAMQVVYSFNNPDSISWDDAPYSAYIGKSNADSLISAFTQVNRMSLR